jgi:hypothetical protein
VTDNEGVFDRYHRDVAARVYMLRVERAARDLMQRDSRAAQDPVDVALLRDILNRDDTPRWRFEGLLPHAGRLLLVAQRKAGKTTLALNVARAILNGDDLLGRYATTPIAGRVAFLNFEVSAAQIARWAADLDLDRDRVAIVNVRGRRNPLADDTDRAHLAARLRDLDVDFLVVDPFGRAFTGTSANDAHEVGTWLATLDRFAHDVGAGEVLLTAHAGWNAERTRGSSALEDWADVIATLTRDDHGHRYLRATGRDVDIEEDRLDHDPATRSLAHAGTGSRRTAAADAHEAALAAVIADIVDTTPGLNVSDIEDRVRAQGLGHQRGQVTTAARALEATGRIERRKEGRTIRHYPRNPDTSQHLPTPPTGSHDDSRPLPIGGESSRESSRQHFPAEERTTP